MIRTSWSYIFLFLTVFLLAGYSARAQKTYTDSLEQLLPGTKDPKKRIALMNALSSGLVKTNPDKALEYSRKALELAEKSGNKSGAAVAYTNLGNFYYVRGNFPEALTNYLALGKVMEELNDKKGIASSYTGIGNVYYAQNDLDKALEYQVKAMKIREELGDKNGLSGCYNNIGNIYQLLKKPREGLVYHRKSLQLKVELGDYKGLSSSYGNIGLILYELEQYDSALVYQQKALKLREELNNKAGQSASYINIASIYEKQGKIEEAISYLEKSVKIAEGIGYREALKNAYGSLSNYHEKLKDSGKALEYYKLYTEVKDTMLNAEKTKQLATLQTVYETEKKEKEILLLTKEREIQNLVLYQQEQELIQQAFENEKKRTEIELLNKEKEIQELALYKKEGELKEQRLITEAREREAKLSQAEAEAQKLMRNFVMAGLGMTLLLAFFIYRGYVQKKKANVELADKNEKIQQAYHIIEQNRDEIAQKNKDIQDSINYAQRIQQAMLPSKDAIKRAFPDSFILYKPRDVVSGDFYSYVEKDGKVIVAAVDCTGHGVPGAFMSMIGNDQLNQIILEHGITKPSEILARLNRGIKQSLKQTDEDSETKDGMDLSLCSFDLANGKVEYAGAKRPLWYARSGELHEISPDETSIGGTTPENFSFTNNVLDLQPGDCFYLFSDGYIDQFGGEKGKKFLNRRFRDLLLEVQARKMEEQYNVLIDRFDEWKQDIMQVDDVLVVGVRC